jgi:predicted short-subunit dehydrogenase-like oxidoreductase (DUF2520 family)
MGQVPVNLQKGFRETSADTHQPVKILIVGNGRVANAFIDFLKARPETPHNQWHRQLGVQFSEFCAAQGPTHVWIAVSDSAINEFAEENFASLFGKTVCHFSGGQSSFAVQRGEQHLLVHATHPLTTFGRTSDSQWVQNFARIPFVLDRTSIGQGFKLESLLPGMCNPFYSIEPTERQYYHALCALAGGMTVMTWESIQARFQALLNLDPQVLSVFKKQIFENLSAPSGTSVLTGPVARGDLKMIATHMDALEKKSEATLMQMYSLLIQLNRLEAAKK